MTNQPTMEMRQILNLSIPEPSDDGTAVIEGRAVPYGETYDMGGIKEVFAKNAADPKALRGKPILWQHDRAEVIGVVEGARNEDDGLYFRAKLIPTDRGRDAQIALRAGAVSGLSIGFMPVADRVDGDTITRTKVDIAEISVATIPAYSGAGITSIREQEKEHTVETTTPEVPTVDLSGLATREDLTELESRIQSLTAPDPTPPVLSAREAFELQMADAHTNRKIRALADVLSSGNAALLPQQFASEVRGYLDTYRYTATNLGSIGFPASGTSLQMPKITQRVTVAARGTEKTEVPTQAFTTGDDAWGIAWFAGAVDVALEVIWQSDPAILPLIVDDLFAAYAVATDVAAQTSLEAAATHTGAALDLTDYGTFVGDLIDGAETIRAATGVWGDMLSVTTADFKGILGLMDADGRRILAPVGAINSDGSSPVLSMGVNIGGVNVFHNPRATTSVQYNKKSARFGEKPPVALSSDNVALAGRDLGVIGATMFADTYPAGILSYEVV